MLFHLAMDSIAPTPVSAGSLKGETTVQEPDRAGRALARRTAETRATVPDLDLGTDVDAAPLLALAAREGCSTTAVLVRACGRALRDRPGINSAYRDGRYERYSRVNVAVAIQTGEVPVTATVLDADTKSLPALEAELRRLEERALAGELTPPEQAGATFTVSDLGRYGVHRIGALVTPTQAAALTAGAIHPAARVRGDAVVAGHELTLALACDHRIVFPAQAAAFLSRIAETLERAE
jgi:pyruvate dehydrogenase E2 component (dihydrolipoamide acetyltransferase)